MEQPGTGNQDRSMPLREDGIIEVQEDYVARLLREANELLRQLRELSPADGKLFLELYKRSDEFLSQQH